MKIENELFAEEAIRVHASTIDGCGDLFYTVSLREFDQIWLRTHAPVDRSGPLPKLLLDFGRHEVAVFVDPDAPDETFHLVGSGQPATSCRPWGLDTGAAIAEARLLRDPDPTERAELASLRAMREALVKASEPPMPPAPPSGTTELRDHRARTIDALLTAIDRELAGAAHPIDRVGTLAHAVAVLAGAPL